MYHAHHVHIYIYRYRYKNINIDLSGIPEPYLRWSSHAFRSLEPYALGRAYGPKQNQKYQAGSV